MFIDKVSCAINKRENMTAFIKRLFQTRLQYKHDGTIDEYMEERARPAEAWPHIYTQRKRKHVGWGGKAVIARRAATKKRKRSKKLAEAVVAADLHVARGACVDDVLGVGHDEWAPGADEAAQLKGMARQWGHSRRGGERRTQRKAQRRYVSAPSTGRVAVCT